MRAHQQRSEECRGKDPVLLDGPPEGYVPPRGSAIERLMIQQGLIPSPFGAGNAPTTAEADGGSSPSGTAPAWPGGPPTGDWARDLLRSAFGADEPEPPPGPDGLPSARSLRVVPPGPPRPGADGTSPPLDVQIPYTATTNVLNWFVWLRGYGYDGTLSDYMNDVHDAFWEGLGGRMVAQFNLGQAPAAAAAV